MVQKWDFLSEIGEREHNFYLKIKGKIYFQEGR